MLVDVIFGVILLLLLIDLAQVRKRLNHIEQLLETQEKINDVMKDFIKTMDKAVGHIEDILEEKE